LQGIVPLQSRQKKKTDEELNSEPKLNACKEDSMENPMTRSGQN
jgi:hypothetical protein